MSVSGCDSWLCNTGNKHMNLPLIIINPPPSNPHPPFLQISAFPLVWAQTLAGKHTHRRAHTHARCQRLHPVVPMCVRLALSQSSAVDILMDSGCPLSLSLFIRVFMISAAGRKCWLFSTIGNTQRCSSLNIVLYVFFR